MVTFGIVICHTPAKDNIFRNNDSCDAMVRRFLETEIPAARRRLKFLRPGNAQKFGTAAFGTSRGVQGGVDSGVGGQSCWGSQLSA